MFYGTIFTKTISQYFVKKNVGFAAERGGNERENYFFASWGVRPNLQKNNSRAQKSFTAAAGSDFYNNILHGVLLVQFNIFSTICWYVLLG
jgi:hypothetical protein